MGNQYITWAILCLAVALVLFFIEVFVPSGGLIGIAAAAAMIAGIVLLFMVDARVGLIGAIVVLLGAPFLLAFAIHLWPNTPVARMLTLRSPSTNQAANQTTDLDESRSTFVGAQGKAVTDLRPVGVCLINGQRIDCLAQAGLIPAGQTVRVVYADGMQIKVVPIDNASNHHALRGPDPD